MLGIFGNIRVAPLKAETPILKENMGSHSSTAAPESKANKGSLSLNTTPESKESKDPLQSPLSLKISTISHTPTGTTPLTSARIIAPDSPEMHTKRLELQKSIREFIFNYLQNAEDYLEQTYPFCFKETKSVNRSSSLNSLDEIAHYLRWEKKAVAKLKKKSFLCCSVISFPKEVTEYYGYLAKIDIDDSPADIRATLVRIIPALDTRLDKAKAMNANDEIHLSSHLKLFQL